MRIPAAALIFIASILPAAFTDSASSGQSEGAPATSLIVDREAEFRMYRKAAEEGDPVAQVLIGNTYLVGDGVPRDCAEAIKWFAKAAEQGNAVALYNLGLMHSNGEGVPQSDAEAARWYRKAAEQGNADAQYDLGVMFANGEGVPRDLVLAHVCFDLAARNFGSSDNREMAAGYRDLVAAKLTPAQIAKAQQIAREWESKTQK